MTRLEALQLILSRAGVNPPAAVDTTGSSDMAQADRILERENKNVQSWGWTFNRVKGAVLLKDTNGTITVPDNALIVRSGGDNKDKIAVAIGRTLYNLTVGENTPTFLTDLDTEYHLLWEFECIPTPIQRLICEITAVQFIEMYAERLRNAPWRLQSSREHMRQAESEARRYDVWQSRPNVLKTAEARKFRGYRPSTLRGETGY